MLFRPVQRMCVYPLLFQQAVKSASPGTPTHDLFKKALDTCSKVVNEVNENVRGQEAQLRTASIVLAEVTGGSSMRDLLQATRHIQMEAMVGMKAQSGLSMEWRVRRQYKWYVFTDVLLICRPNRFGDQYHKKMILTLADCSISRSKGAGPPPKEAEPEVSMSFKPSMSLTSRQQAAAAAARGGGVSPGASSSKTSALKEIEEGLKEASARAASPVSVAGTNPAARKRWQTALQKARDQGLVKTKKPSLSYSNSDAEISFSDLMSTGGGGKSKSKKGGFMAVLKAAQKEKRETEAAAAEEKEEAAEAKSGLEKPEVLHLMCNGTKYKCWADSEVEMHRLVSKIQELKEGAGFRSFGVGGAVLRAS
jgi:hypothetical protein